MARLSCQVTRNVVAADGGGGARARQLERCAAAMPQGAACFG
jgi:hypothetical protein